MSEQELSEDFLADALAGNLQTMSVVPIASNTYIWVATDKGFSPRLETKREYIWRKKYGGEQ